MAKNRKSLGILTLPLPNDEYTWEEYKQRYGVDLASIFPTKMVGGHTRFDFAKSPTKLVCVSGLMGYGYYPDVTPVDGIHEKSLKNGDDEVIGVIIYIAVSGYDEDEEATFVIGRLIITAFDDPESDNLIGYSEL